MVTLKELFEQDLPTAQGQNFLKIGENIQKQTNCSLVSNWPQVIHTIHMVTKAITRAGFKVRSDVAAGSSFTYTVNLVASGIACMCPLATFSGGSLGPQVDLTVLVNDGGKATGLPPEWIDKNPFKDEPMPTDPGEPRIYVFIPKVTVDVTFSNSNTVDESKNVTYHATFDQMNLDAGVALITNCFTPISLMWTDLSSEVLKRNDIRV